MKARIKPGYDEKRQQLADIVPLDAPFTLFISPTQVCNFKCSYCTQGLPQEERARMGFVRTHVQEDLFDKISNDVEAFRGSLKRILFTGLGEPLANPKLPEMIAELSMKRVARGFEIITNGYLLTHGMTDRLLAAGLTFLRVSIQGLSAERYREIAGVEIDFGRLLDNLRYFYECKGEGCRLYVKIMDECFTEDETEEDFYRLFGDFCDDIYVEHLVNAQPSMGGRYSDEMNAQMTFYGDVSKERAICPYMFYSLQIDVAGETFPCPPLGLPKSFSLGNVREKSLWEIWHSKRLYDYYKMQLSGRRKKMHVCGRCENYKCFTPEEDNLDEAGQEILRRLDAREWV